MKRLAVVIGVFLFAFFLLLSCGGGGGSEEDLIPKLEGSWVGWIEDDSGSNNIKKFEVDIDGAGQVVDVRIDNVSMGDVGQINPGYEDNDFYVDTNNRLGIMIVDDQFSHATYGQYSGGGPFPNYYLGALEKDVMVAPLYSVSDIVDSYPTGLAYEISAGIWEGDAVSMAVSSDLTFTGSASGENFSGGFDPGLYDSSHGRYAGSLIRQIMPPVKMYITAYISPDGEALSAFASTTATPSDLEGFILMGFKK